MKITIPQMGRLREGFVSILQFLKGSIMQTGKLINFRRLMLPMSTPMDRDFGDNVFRKMERAKVEEACYPFAYRRDCEKLLSARNP